MKKIINYQSITLMLSTALIIIAPFVSSYLVIIPLFIHLFKLFRYGGQLFRLDIAYLLPFASLFLFPGGDSAYIVLILVYVATYLVSTRKVNSRLFVIICIETVYFLLRQNGKITSFLFLIALSIYLFVSVEQFDADESARLISHFCAGLLVSSFLGILLRGRAELTPYLHNEIAAYMGSSEFRFKALFSDPNYYAASLILAIGLTSQQYFANKISIKVLFARMSFYIFFGLLTYSKTFVVLLLIFVVMMIHSLFKSRRYYTGVFFTLSILVVIALTLAGRIPALNVIIHRFTAATTLSEVTTGRTVQWRIYLEAWTSTWITFLFGEGFDAPILVLGAHNLYIEVLYYSGLIGFIIYFSVIAVAIKNSVNLRSYWAQKVAAFIPVILLAICFLSLQALFSTTFLIQIVLVCAGIRMTTCMV